MKQFRIKLFLLLFLDISNMYSMHKKNIPITLPDIYKIFKQYVYKNQNKKLTQIIINPSQNWKHEIEECLKNDADINCVTLTTLSHERGTPLFYAAEHSNAELVSYLLDYNADVNACTSSGATPLHAIIARLWDNPAKFDLKIVEKLLRYGANPNTKLRTGDTILSWATKKGSNELIKMLIDYGADVNQRNALLLCTPLWHVIRNLQLTKMLCNAGASLVNIDFITGFSAFHEAVYRKLPKQYFEILITHVQVDTCNKKANKKLKETALGTLLIFNKLNSLTDFPKIPQELQWYILSYLALDSCSEFNKEFCKEIVKKGFENRLIRNILNKRIIGLEEILQIPNSRKDTALQHLHKQYKNDPYAQDIEPLLNQDKVYRDLHEFNKITDLTLVPRDNLIGKMHENISQTILDNSFYNNH